MQILSDSERRTQYDRYLLTQRKIIQKQSGQGAALYTYKAHATTYKQMEVVEWLKWYRSAINDILSERRVVVGTGYFDALERDFYSAIHAAFYGPVIEFMDFLPERFEAEERSAYETSEVLHLVSGRDLFGMVCLVNKVPELPFYSNQKLDSFSSVDMGIRQSVKDVSFFMNSDGMNYGKRLQVETCNVKDNVSDAYTDLELHVSGKVVAMATRVPSKGYCDGMQNEEAQDQIHVFLNSSQYPTHINQGIQKSCFSGDGAGSKIPLGTISGLGTSPEEGTCFVYNSSGTKTHVIMKHRTLMVCKTGHFFSYVLMCLWLLAYNLSSNLNMFICI